MDLASIVVLYALVGLGVSLLAMMKPNPIKRTRRSYLRLVAIAVTAVAIINGVNFAVTASADHRPVIYPNDVAAAYGMPVDVPLTVEFGTRPTNGHQPVFTINPYRPRSINGDLIVTFYGTAGVPAVFEVPNKKLHLRQTVSATQPTTLTLVLDKTAKLGNHALLTQSDCRLSMETAATACVRTEVFSDKIGDDLTHQGLGPVIQRRLTDVTLVVPADIYRMLREDRGEG
jgi:hypothetical protein